MMMMMGEGQREGYMGESQSEGYSYDLIAAG